MATLLLVIIYIAFIGLGIPDSLFGTAWPVIYREFALPISSANFVTLLISGGTVVSSLLSAKVINRFGTGMVTMASTCMTAAALLGFSVSGNLFWLCIFAVPLGLGAGAIDSALNNYVALHYKATHMNFLHCFYGVGVSLSPYLMSLVLSGAGDWRDGYKLAFFLQLSIAFITVVSIPIWKKVQDSSPLQHSDVQAKTLSMTSLCKIPSVRMVWCIFIGSCAIEYICGTWGSTFLVDSKGMTVDMAARIITFYYIGMALGRFLSGVLANTLTSWQLIHIGQGIVLLAILFLILPLPSAAAGIGLFMIGFGNGPIFPNLIHLTPVNFGKEISQSVMGSQMAAAYLGIMLAPILFGLLAQTVGTGVFSYFLLAMFLMMVASTILLIRKLKEQKKYSV